jgi:hypothetical protein
LDFFLGDISWFEFKEGKRAIGWTRLSCRSFAANAVRFQIHALAYNLGNFLRTLATPEPIQDRSLTSLKEKLIEAANTEHISRTTYLLMFVLPMLLPS